jgi:segregation and condensation protein A
LELFREAAIAFEQAEALGELTVRWTGTDEGDIEVSDEFDEFDDVDESDESDETDQGEKTAVVREDPHHD